MISLVTKILMMQFHQAARQKTGAGQQHHRKRRLHNDEDLLRQG
jgi:hypothetical protein